MKKTLSLIISILLLVSMATVAFAAPTVAYDGTTVILSGTVDGASEGAPATVLIVKPDASGNEVNISAVTGATTTAAFLSALEYAGVVTLGEDGAIPSDFSVTLNDSLPSGFCGVYINYLGQNDLVKVDTFKHVNATELAALVARFNAPDADYASILTVANIDMLKSIGIKDASYDALVNKTGFYAKLKAFAPFEQGRPDASLSAALNFSASFNHALALSYLAENADTLTTLGDYNDVYWTVAIGATDDFTNLEQTEKDAILASVKAAPFAKGSDVTEAFKLYTGIKVFGSKVNNKTDVEYFLTNYWNDFDLDLSLYNATTVSDYDRADICQYILTNKSGADSYQTIKALYYAAISSIQSSGGSSGGGSSSKPGGSFGVGGATSSNVPVVGISPELENGAKPLPFKDVDDSHWAYSYVSRLYKNNIVSGKSEDSFKPADAITREEFVKIVVEAFNIPVAGVASFADVKDGAWYVPYVAAAVNAGIINGTGDGNFGVGKKITRQDAAVIIGRAAGMNATNPLTFADETSVAQYAKGAVAAMVNEGIITGYEDKTFKPGNEISRAESCTVICRLLDKKGGLK